MPSCTCSPSPGAWGYRSSLDDFDRIGADVPLLVNLQPAGQHLMEDFHRAGGLLAVLHEVEDLLDPAAQTVTGRPLVHYLAGAEIWDREVIRERKEPLQDAAGIAVLRGNLAPSGAIIKPRRHHRTCCSTEAGRLVFDSIEDLHARLDDPELDADADSVLVLRGCGPRGYPGDAGVSNMPPPAKLLREGVRDTVWICDGRMSGTPTGRWSCTSPRRERQAPVSKIWTGDWIVLDVLGRRVRWN